MGSTNQSNIGYKSLPPKKRRPGEEADEIIEDLERRIDIEGCREMNQTYSYKEITDDVY